MADAEDKIDLKNVSKSTLKIFIDVYWWQIKNEDMYNRNKKNIFINSKLKELIW